tara:strand:- start:20 stop:187 length:168 start_codon:yes stop_codon:yes gene_type:complete
MSNISIVIIVYILGLIFGAVIFGLWDNNTGPKSLIGMVWTIFFLITLFYAEKKDR